MNSKFTKLNKDKVIEAFNKMDFGEVKESTQLAEKWLAKNFSETKGTSEAILNVLTQKVAFFSKIDGDLNNCIYTIQGGSYFKNSMDKFSFFFEIIDTLKKNTELILQLEMCIRGISYKDTEPSLEMFFDFLKIYSSKGLMPCNCESVHLLKMPVNAPLFYLGHAIAYSLHFYEGIFIKADPKMFVILDAIMKIISPICDKHGIKVDISASTNCPKMTSKTPVLIFNDADINSACDSVINAAFREQGQMPWSVNTIFVQEDILDNVVNKLKHLLSKLTFGESNNKQVDFSLPYLVDNFQLNYDTVVANAKAKGIEVYSSENPKQQFSALLFTGGKLYSNNVITPNEARVPYLNVMGFRSIKEAVSLCNNQQQSFAATVWSNNVALTNEIVHNLNVGTVWINTHGILKAGVPFTLYENGLVLGRPVYHSNANEVIPQQFQNLVNKAKNAQLVWSKKTTEVRINLLQNIALKLNADKSGSVKNNKWQNALIGSHLYESSAIKVYGSIELKQFKQPNCLIYYNGDIENHEDSIIMALRNGSAVLLVSEKVTKCKETFSILGEISAQLSDVLQIVYNQSSCFDLSKNDILLCFNEIDIISAGNYKNVWTSMGENYV